MQQSEELRREPSSRLRLRELTTSGVGRQAKYLFTHERAQHTQLCGATRGVLFVVNHKVKPKPKPKPKPLTCCGYAADFGTGDGREKKKKEKKTESDRVIPFGLY